MFVGERRHVIRETEEVLSLPNKLYHHKNSLKLIETQNESRSNMVLKNQEERCEPRACKISTLFTAQKVNGPI